MSVSHGSLRIQMFSVSFLSNQNSCGGVIRCGVCLKLRLVPLRGRHQSSIYPDRGEEWQERTVFVILFHYGLWFSVCIFVFSLLGGDGLDGDA